MAKFVKGAERPMNAGRKPGVANKMTPLLKDAILLAGAIGGDLLVEREIIERRLRHAAENDSPESAGELQQLVEKHGSRVGYIAWLSIEHAPAYARLLGGVMQLQVRADSHKDIGYRTVEEIQRDIMALQPKYLIAMLLRNVSSSDSPEDRRLRSWTSRARR
jgi:hypothetical protein